jgi:dipeptidyl aminopeptidase/acylaminoacyl peptidase
MIVETDRGRCNMSWTRRGITVLFAALAACASPAQAGQTLTPHPDRQGAVVESFAEHPAGHGPWPTVVFLHGHQPSRVGGRAFVSWGVLDRFAKAGYLAVAVSLPSYGGSSGPEDFAGPFTQHAVRAVIDDLRRTGQAAPDEVLIQGVSLGAVTGALVAAADPDIAGLVLISGVYDLPAFFAQPKSVAAAGIKANAIALTGGSDEALRSRSPLLQGARIQAATLILNGAKDDRTDADQARRLAAMIQANGGRAVVRIYPDFGHEIPVEARDAEVTAFIAATVGPASAR